MGSSPSVAELPGWALELLADARVARLGVIDDAGRPRVLPVTYALHVGAFVSAIDHKRKAVAAEQLARVRWLRARPRAAITIDHYEDDWARLAWVQALGRVKVLDAGDAGDAIAALTARYEQYRSRPPTGPVLTLAPERLVWWRAS
jgi:PPOX class probable F420-dependent enzyme